MRYAGGSYPGDRDAARGTAARAAPPGSTRATAITVSRLNESARALVEGSFGRFWIRGEVSGFKSHRSGHWYFSLRDAAAQMACVVWNSDQRGIPAPPDEGMQVIALAQLTLYPQRGALQLRITRLEAAGDGLWRKAMELVVSRLRADGLLAEERKRPLPRYPDCVAVVTSPDGAALRDIVSVARRRGPSTRIVVCGAAVQGDGAPRSICSAIERVARWNCADVLIVGRGGGSREDLHAFNDESVARAIAACRIPVVSAVGHEIDITVCDLVADVRAATPSAAAEAAIPALDEIYARIGVQRKRLSAALGNRVAAAAVRVRNSDRALRAAAIGGTGRRRAQVAETAGRLNALSPLATLSRGYAVARDSDGRTLTSAAQFSPGQEFGLLLHDGEISARTVE